MADIKIQETNQPIANTNSLARLIMEDILRYLRLKRRNLLRKLLALVGKGPSTWLAEILARYEKRIIETSFLQASREALSLFSDGIQLHGQENIPTEGGLLVVANHPGLADALGALVSVGRENVTIVAGKRDILRALPNLRRYFLELETEINLRANATREIIRLLSQNKTVIIFPRGALEPEPSLVGGTLESLTEWSRSIGIFLAKVPDTHLVPMLISRVLTEKAWNSWIARRFKTLKRRHQMAMVAQFVMQRLSKNPIWKIPIRIDVGEVQTAREIDPDLDPKNLAESAKSRVAALLQTAYPSE